MLERVDPPCLVFWTSGNLANIVFYATYIDLVQELPAEHAEVLLSGSADVYRQASNLKSRVAAQRSNAIKPSGVRHGCQGSEILGGCPRENAAWDRHSRRRGARNTRPQGPECGAR